MYREGVSALIINNQNDFLLVNLTSFEERFFAIPGGGLDEGGSLEDAVYREIYEELGIEKTSLKLIGKSSTPLQITFKKTVLRRDGKEYKGSERYFFGFEFIGNNEEIKLKAGEVRISQWVPFEKLKNYLLFENQLEATQEKILEIFPFIKKQVIKK